ncbi:DUF6119 family protein [Amycolatopsis sp. H20-H5]|uniref:DUF6119 family protein n=1 Tax=Amycolatopsis sp. H20-H5 TaxID=3046309 RepID=UPI002DBFF7FB|nr:DUF6119 family protein [Amycolatopsis sp. H20-H5]MEC3978141.1 DUF6119 family protein [Amycolatopsis sp. H20-H5]
MSAKRSNNAIWKLVVPEGMTPQEQLEDVLSAYDELVTEESNYKPLTAVPLKQSLPGMRLDLHVRSSFSLGLLPFVQGYLVQSEDARKFQIKGADACLFLATDSSLFAITSGGGYHVIANFVDYAFPFDTAKKLISNNFSATDVRDMTGSKTSRSETYRRTYSIDKSEAMDTVWKKLVGRLDAERLPEDSPLRGLINPDKPPAIEIKSSFVLRQKLELKQVGKMISELENLPEPSPEQLRQLSFLDNLYPIKNDKDLTDELTRQFVEDIRQAMLIDSVPDIDLLDPYDIISFNAGSTFKLSRAPISDTVPDLDDLLGALHNKLAGCLQDEEVFFGEFSRLSLSYRIDPDDTSRTARRKLIDFLHGQVDYDGKTYFRMDRVWYRCLGDFLENLKRDFIDEVFVSENPLLLGSEVAFLPWEGGSEGSFNEKQAARPDFYFGDEIFAHSDLGKIELFDLLKVDSDSKRLYLIHTKKDFAAKMRDACSQILVSAEVISADVVNEKKQLAKFYREEWSKHSLNETVDEATFLSWFDYELVFVVLCSTPREFVADDFLDGKLKSHIARREILAAKNEMKRNGRIFRLAHTKYS